MSILNAYLSKAERMGFIESLTDVLAPLRAKVGISQDELSSFVGVSRQTYSLIECKKKPMSWPVYLSLIMFFDYNAATHQMLRSINAFPDELIERFNPGGENPIAENSLFLGKQTKEAVQMIEALDERGVHALKTVLLVEYSRCTNLPGDVVIKAFDGVDFVFPSVEDEEKTAEALKNIKRRNNEQK